MRPAMGFARHLEVTAILLWLVVKTERCKVYYSFAILQLGELSSLAEEEC